MLNLTTFIHPECGTFPDIVRVKVVNYDDIEKNDVYDLHFDVILINSRPIQQFQLPKVTNMCRSGSFGSLVWQPWSPGFSE